MMHLCALLLSVLLASSALAEVPDPDPERFAEEIAAFKQWDSKNAAPENSLLFVGSSSIRLWPTAEAFPGFPIVNRGFGGSELSDAVYFYDVLIKRHAPVKIFVYSGENDVWRGKSARQVLEDFEQLVGMIRVDFPETDIVFLSIKPSRSRQEKWPEMIEANRLIRDFIDERPKLAYADVATVLLDASGEPGDVFVDDDLHLNERGYALWREVLVPYLD